NVFIRNLNYSKTEILDSRLRISGMTDEKAFPSEGGDSVFILMWCGSSHMGVYPKKEGK
ncbi:MAG: hypothetical protein PWP04_1006, partial [Candidatus Atribacteria bacterium]|nr:hypothetical protein [Candidatus Atribacteria bacterium]